MKKRLFIYVIMAALLASCSVSTDSDNSIKNLKTVDPEAVNFSVYVNKSTSTKAGLAGQLTTDRLKEAGAGFGVFAYYGNGALYNETSKPDFMYNQKVEYKTVGTTNTWTYEPVKYWPNEFGAEASSETADRLTFFAYAPYVAVTPSTGLVTGDGTSGIIGMTRNITAGDPMVMYETNLVPGNGVDLCWGVAAENFTSSVDGDQNNVDQGYPFLNVIKPKTGDKIAFDFNHALAQLNVQVDADIDVESHNGEELANDGTRVYVRSVTFNGFALRGSLNLNSNKTNGPAWFDISGTGRVKREPVTIHDGRTNGIEGMTTAQDPNETPAGLNAGLIQSQPYDPAVLDGVKHQPVNLFASTTADAPIMVVPVTGVPLSVTIVYDIETADSKLLGYLSDGVTHGVSVENVITKNIPDMILSAGKCYVLNIHLGLTSVKLDAEVKSWVETDPINTDLPQNIASIGSVNLTNSGNPVTAVTVWKNQTSLAAPEVAVNDMEGNPLSGCTIEWASDATSVATVAEDGTVTLTGSSGTAKITATAKRDGMSGSASASYDVYVNEITGISVTPASSYVGVGGKVTLTATLTHTNLGTVGTLPTISWVSGSTDYVTISAATGNSTQATGVAEGSSVVTASVDDDYVQTGISASASGTVKCLSSMNLAFRGYWVSPGILYKKDDGNYGLTNERDGSNFNVFEIYDYFNNAESLNKYYFKWFDLRTDLGSDGNNIATTSTKLPEGWSFPTGGGQNGDIYQIFKGTPKTEIRIGNTILDTDKYNTSRPHPFARVTVNKDNKTYLGVILFRDGANIPDVNLAVIGQNSKYSDNLIDYDTLKKFLDEQCLFISCTGYYNGSWKYLLTGSEGKYWTSTYYNDAQSGYYTQIDSNAIQGTTHTNTGASYYLPVRLVKQATGPMYP